MRWKGLVSACVVAGVAFVDTAAGSFEAMRLKKGFLDSVDMVEVGGDVMPVDLAEGSCAGVDIVGSGGAVGGDCIG